VFRVRPTVAFACVFLAVVFTVTAQEGAQVASPADEADDGAAVPVLRVNPDYPERALRQGSEGWVELSFVVSEVGDVVEPMIEQSSGGDDFERAALRAVSQWKYKPAIQDGVPVERALKTIIRFQVEVGGIPFSERERASPAFAKSYRQLVELVDAQDFARAAELLAEMEAERLNRYETAFLWWAKYVYLSRTSPTDLAQMRRALERAVGDEEDMYLSTDQFVAAAERLVVLHAQAADIAAAINMFERLRDTVAEIGTDSAGRSRVESYARSIDGLQPGYEAMLDLVKSDRLMAMEGVVGEFDYWVHDLLRRSFSLARINGRLDSLDIRCERGRGRIDAVAVETVWRVPEDWGACGIYIKGEPGATFAFREYPAGFAPANLVDVSRRAAR
jgi:TonB family protein